MINKLVQRTISLLMLLFFFPLLVATPQEEIKISQVDWQELKKEISNLTIEANNLLNQSQALKQEVEILKTQREEYKKAYDGLLILLSESTDNKTNTVSELVNERLTKSDRFGFIKHALFSLIAGGFILTILYFAYLFATGLRRNR